MNPSGQEQMSNNEHSYSSRLEALIREHRERHRTNNGSDPPSLLEAHLLRANSASNDHASTSQQRQQEMSQATPSVVRHEEQQISAVSSSSSSDNHQLQRALLMLEAQRQQEQRRQLERQQVVQRQLVRQHQEDQISGGARPGAQSFPSSNSAAFQAIVGGESGNEFARQRQLQRVSMMAARKQQEENSNRARGPQAANEAPTRGTPSAALLRILARNEQQKFRGNRQQKNNVQPQQISAEQRSLTHPSTANDTSLEEENGALPGSDMASAVRRNALLVAAHAREQKHIRQQERVRRGHVPARETTAVRRRAVLVAAHAREQERTRIPQQQRVLRERVLRGYVPSRETTPEGSTTLQQRAYLLELQRQAQQNQGSSFTNTAPQQLSSQRASLPSVSGQAETEAATSRFLKDSTSRIAQIDQLLAVNTALRNEMEQALRSPPPPPPASRPTEEAANESFTHPAMLATAGRILPLGAANRAPFQDETMQNASIHPSILQATRQAMIQSDSSSETKSEQSDRKRKVDDTEKQQEGQGAAKKSAVEQPSANVTSFPMPSLTSARNVHTSKLLSFRSLWDELEDSEMQEEIFRQKIYQRVKIVGDSRSIKKKD